MEDIIDKLTSKDNLKPYWQQYRDGNKAAATPFLKEMETTINNAVYKFAQNDQSYKTQARLLALDSVKSYDPDKGAGIKTHVFNSLQRLQRIAAQRGNLTRISENASLQRAVVNKAKKEFEIDNGYEPTTEDLATITGFSRKRIDDLAKYSAIAPDSLTVSPEGDSLVQADTDKALDLYDNYIYNELDRIDKKIYEWSTGYGGNKLLSRAEMADKLGISQAAVSKRASKISSKFNQDRDMIKRYFSNGRV